MSVWFVVRALLYYFVMWVKDTAVAVYVFIRNSYRAPDDPFTYQDTKRRAEIMTAGDQKIYKRITERLNKRFEQRGNAVAIRGLENAYVFAGSGAFLLAGLALMATLKQRWAPPLFIPALFIFSLSINCFLNAIKAGREKAVKPTRTEDELVEIYEQIRGSKEEWEEAQEAANCSGTQRSRGYFDSTWGDRGIERVKYGLIAMVLGAVAYSILNVFF